MPKFSKRPVVIEAVRYTGDNINEVWDLFGAGVIYGPAEDDASAYIETLEGRMEAKPGDWIIKGVQGELYPCKPDIFAATYEASPDLATQIVITVLADLMGRKGIGDEIYAVDIDIYEEMVAELATKVRKLLNG